MFMTAADYRESLRAYKPRVFVEGDAVETVADEPRLAPGIAAVGVTYDLAGETRHRPVMTATEAETGETVNRFLHINRTTTDLMRKLEAVRLVCQETGCAQRYLTQDALNAIYQASHRTDAAEGTDYHARFKEYLRDVQARDLTLGVAMTDGKGDRAKRPHAQTNPDVYVHMTERRPGGIVISGAKAIVTGAPYMHEYLVMPCRNMTAEDADFAVCCAVPVDAEGVTIISRRAGRPGDESAKFSATYGQSTGVVVFEDVFVPDERVFLAGEWAHSQFLTRSYATHHRHSCIGARAGFGDLLIGAGLLMSKENGLALENTSHLRHRMVELIKIVEGIYACGIASSVHGEIDPSGAIEPERIFANVGKLLLSTQIYDMQRIAHELSGGLLVALPGPDEDHNPETAGNLAELLAGNADIPYAQRIETARFLEDLTASSTAGWYSLISMHGGGSPGATELEIYRSYPLQDKAALVERLLDRGLMDKAAQKDGAQPGQCCDTGCQPVKAAD